MINWTIITGCVQRVLLLKGDFHSQHSNQLDQLTDKFMCAAFKIQQVHHIILFRPLKQLRCTNSGIIKNIRLTVFWKLYISYVRYLHITIGVESYVELWQTPHTGSKILNSWTKKLQCARLVNRNFFVELHTRTLSVSPPLHITRDGRETYATLRRDVAYAYRELNNWNSRKKNLIWIFREFWL